MKIGVLGGTFDPIHAGHLILAEQVVHSIGLSKVLFIPSNRPPHKDERMVAPIQDRINMISLAIEDNPRFELSTIECEIDGKSYTYKTLERLKLEYDSDTAFYFIVGSDVLEELLLFRNYETVLKNCSFVTGSRAGADKQKIDAIAEDLISNYNAKIYMIPFTEIGISSTLIRDRIRKMQSIRYLIPDDVNQYISENRLYR